MLKKYSELTDEQKKLVYVMFSNQATVEHYLYNFDGARYVGRQYVPPAGVIAAEPVEASKPAPAPELEEVDPEPELKPTKRTRRAKK